MSPRNLFVSITLKEYVQDQSVQKMLSLFSKTKSLLAVLEYDVHVNQAYAI